MAILAPVRRTETHKPAHQARRSRWTWVGVAASAVALLLAVGMLSLAFPLPGLEGYLKDTVIERVSSQIACPGTLTKAPEVVVGGGTLMPQVVRQRLQELYVIVPDATLNGVPHASFTATMRDVSQSSGGTRVGSMDATITVGFANLPTAKGAARPTFKQTEDGGLAVEVVMPAEAAKNVKAKLFLKMSLRGETARSVPERLEIFGKSIPAAQVSDLAGGVRTQQLPHLPAGLTYRSIAPRADGLHVALAGVSTTPLDELPTEVDGREVSYTAKDGLLGIETSAIGVPLTIFTKPVLSGSTLTLRPQLVHILGGDHQPDDAVAKLVLSQIDEKDLVQTLPALPSGVTYRSVSVDTGGIKLVVSGTTVKPFSSVQQSADGRPTTFGAEDGFLTAVAKGGSGEGTKVTLWGKPAIHDNVLDISPDQIEMFGVRFPAAAVLAEVDAQQTTFALQKLPEGLSYIGVDVLVDGLAIHLSGQDVILTKGALTGGTC